MVNLDTLVSTTQKNHISLSGGSSQITILEKDNKQIEIKTNYNNFIKNNSIYVPEDFIKNIL